MLAARFLVLGMGLLALTVPARSEAQILPPTTTNAQPKAVAIPYDASAGGAQCPPGSVEEPNVVAGKVCRVVKSGIKLTKTDENGSCPGGYRLMTGSDGDYCTSDLAGIPINHAHTAILAEISESCGPRMAPVIDSHGHRECTLNPLMEPFSLFDPVKDCPTGTYFGNNGYQTGCLQR